MYNILLKIVLLIFMTLMFNVSYGQISGMDINKADLLIEKFQSHVDSIKLLTNRAKIYYFSDTLFKGIILTMENGNNIELDLRYINNFRGYTKLKADFENFVLIEHRGDGSGNPTQLRAINKKTSDDFWLGENLFYLDKVNEIAVYLTYTDSNTQIVIHDFLNNKLETYSTKDFRCQWFDELQVIQLNNKIFIINCFDIEGNRQELIMKRIK